MAYPHLHPHVLILCMDDAAFWDLGRTPAPYQASFQRINALFRDGDVSLWHYMTQHICSPARYTMLTGKNSVLNGMYDVVEETDDNYLDYLPTGALTIHKHWGDNGYLTGHWGKWHLGRDPADSTPAAWGIDHLVAWSMPAGFTGLGAGSNYGAALSNAYTSNPETYYQTRDDIITADLVSWITANALANMLCMTVSFNAPHTPIVAQTVDLNEFPSFQGGYLDAEISPAQIYYAAFKQTEDNIDAIADAMMAIGSNQEHWKNTIAILTADNGPGIARQISNSYDQWGSLGYYRSYKGQVGNGGVSPFFMIRGPNIPQGVDLDIATVAAEDLAPTLAHMCDIDPWPDTDGEIRTEVFQGQNVERTRPVVRFTAQISAATVETIHRFPQFRVYFPDVGPNHERIDVFFNIDESGALVSSSLQIYKRSETIAGRAQMVNLVELDLAGPYMPQVQEAYSIYKTLPSPPYVAGAGQLEPNPPT